MKKNILSQKYYQDDTSQKLIKLIEENIPELDDATLYYEFPLIRHLDGTVITSSIMIISKIYGVLLFKCDDIIKQRTFDEIEFLDNELSNIESVIFSKLIKSTNKKLKLNKRNLSFNLNSALYTVQRARKTIIPPMCAKPSAKVIGTVRPTRQPTPQQTAFETAKDIGRMSVAPSTPIWRSALSMTDITGTSAYAWTLKIQT